MVIEVRPRSVDSQTIMEGIEDPKPAVIPEVVAVDAAMAKPVDEDEYPKGMRLIAILMAAWLSMFLVALDRTILGTAIPKITDDFHSIADVGWYASAYLLTTCAFQLIYGRIYTFYTTKWVLLWATGLFEVGSILCGTAPTSKAFIVGRAIAGLGGAGIFSGAVNILVLSVPLHKRPMYQGVFGAVFGIASILGPIVGGAFTTKVSWRWCFYINLPVGVIVVLIVLVLLPAKSKDNKDTLKQKIVKLDPYGTIVFLPGIICLLLALQWGGTTYTWSSWRIILCFVLAAILLAIFVTIQFRSGDNATVPIRIICQRSVASGCYFSSVSAGAMMSIIYFLPIWFQAIKGDSAVHSGISTLPMVLSLVVASMISGIITQKSGYYVPQLIACSVILSIGAGLLTTLQVTTPSSQWIAYQFLFGFGLGLGMMQANMAAQTCLGKNDVMTGVALMFFFQGLGGAILISIAQLIFTSSLVSNLKGLGIGIPAQVIVHTGATDLRKIVPIESLPAVLVGYNNALRDVFRLALGCAVATILSGLTMEWRNVKGLKEGGAEAGKAEKVRNKDVESGTATRVETAERPVSPEGAAKSG